MPRYNTIYYHSKGDYYLKEDANTYLKCTQKDILDMVDEGYFPVDVKFKKIKFRPIKKKKK